VSELVRATEGNQFPTRLHIVHCCCSSSSNDYLLVLLFVILRAMLARPDYRWILCLATLPIPIQSKIDKITKENY